MGQTQLNLDKRAQRLELEGGFNFRDLGGYETSDDQVVRSGRIYRSGMMSHISDAGHASLAQLGIHLICDLRTTKEREQAPTRWQAAGVKDYWSRDYDMSGGELFRLMRNADNTAAETRAAMIANYRELAFEQVPAYRHLFQRIADGHLPVVFNCSAGKDRTGVAAALLLTLLGVPRHTVLHDYELTNETMAEDAAILLAKGILKGDWRTDEGFKPLIVADADYLSAMFDAVEKTCGSVDNFLERELGVGRAQKSAIKHELLEPR